MRKIVCALIFICIVTLSMRSYGGTYSVQLIGDDNPCPESIENYLLEIHYTDNSGFNYVLGVDDTWGWSFEGATRISGGTGGFRYVNLKINDVSKVKVSVHVYRLGNTTYPTVNEDVTFTLKPKSVKNLTPSLIAGDTSIYKHDVVQKTYSIDALQYPDGEVVGRYGWIIPVGWKHSGTISNGTTPFLTSSPSITVTTDECTGGNISVYAINDACSDGANSNSKSISISRPWSNYFISGSPVICTTGSYFLSGLPSEAVVNWDCSSNLSRSSSQGSSRCTFTENGSGESWIEATIATSCGSLKLPRKAIWIGAPRLLGYMTIPNMLCSDIPFILNPVIPNGTTIASVTGLSGGIEVPLSEISSCSYDVPGDVFKITLTLVNKCGSVVISRLLRKANCLNFSIYPNPSSGETTITIEFATEDAKSMVAGNDWTLEVYDQSQALKAKKMNLKGKETRLNTSGWKEGVYIVRVNYNGEVLTEKLLVKNQ